VSETDNVDALIGLLQSDFTVYREVEVRHALFRRRSLRVDVLAVPVDPALSDIAVAFEVKGYAVWDSDTLARCLKQAGDYVLSSVEARSKDASTHNGKRVMATFVYPPLHPYSDKMSGKEAYLLNRYSKGAA